MKLYLVVDERNEAIAAGDSRYTPAFQDKASAENWAGVYDQKIIEIDVAEICQFEKYEVF